MSSSTVTTDRTGHNTAPHARLANQPTIRVSNNAVAYRESMGLGDNPGENVTKSHEPGESGDGTLSIVVAKLQRKHAI